MRAQHVLGYHLISWLTYSGSRIVSVDGSTAATIKAINRPFSGKAASDIIYKDAIRILNTF